MKEKLNLIDKETLDKTLISEWVKDRPKHKDFFWFPIEGKVIVSYEKVKLFTKKITIPIIALTLAFFFTQLFFYVTSNFEDSWYLWGALMSILGGAAIFAAIELLYIEDKRKFYNGRAAAMDKWNISRFETWLSENKIRLVYKDRYYIYKRILNQTFLYPGQEIKTQLTTEDLRSFVLVKNKNGSLSLNQPYIDREAIQTTNFVYFNKKKIEKLGTEKLRLYREQLQNRIKILLTYDQNMEDRYDLESYLDSLKQLNALDNDYSTLSKQPTETFETGLTDALYQISEAVESKEKNQIDKIGTKMSILNKYLNSKKKTNPITGI